MVRAAPCRGKGFKERARVSGERSLGATSCRQPYNQASCQPLPPHLQLSSRNNTTPAVVPKNDQCDVTIVLGFLYTPPLPCPVYKMGISVQNRCRRAKWVLVFNV